MSQVRFERKNMVMVVSSIDDQNEMQFYTYDDEDRSYGENALTNLLNKDE
jgi:hypothetical protein